LPVLVINRSVEPFNQELEFISKVTIEQCILAQGPKGFSEGMQCFSRSTVDASHTNNDVIPTIKQGSFTDFENGTINECGI
jgi:hypothetical protein